MAALFVCGLHQSRSEETSSNQDVEQVIQPSGVQASPGQYPNWVTLGVGGVIVNGDNGQYQYQHQLSEGAFGGIESLHYEKPIGSSKWLLQLDARAIFDNNDYFVRLDLTNPEVGYLRGGYRQFRTWYDDTGGFYYGGNGFPTAGRSQWIDPYDEDSFHIDRGEAWVEAGLTLPNLPVVNFRYAYQFRQGIKDSTIWGDYNVGLGPGTTANLRGIVPSFYNIDEKRHVIEADVEHTLGKTYFGAGVRYEMYDQNDSLNVHRRPGDAVTTSSSTGGNRYFTQDQGVDSDLLNVRAFTETRFNENTLLTVGYTFGKMTSDVSGSRIYSSVGFDQPYTFPYPSRQQRDEGFYDLSGHSTVYLNVATVSLMFQPQKDWVIVPSINIEQQNQDASDSFVETNVGAGPAFAAILADISNTRHRSYLDIRESLDIRYTGFRDWSLYARGEWTEGQGDLTEVETETDTGAIDRLRSTDSSRLVQRYCIGANWYPCSRASLAAQYYYKSVANDYDNVIDPTMPPLPSPDGNYPAFITHQNYNTQDVNFRVTVHPAPALTMVSRYDFQLTTYNMQGDYSPLTSPPPAALAPIRSLAEIQTAQRTNHIFSQSLSWMPHPRLYLSGSFSYVFDETTSGAVNQAQNLLQNSDNTYWYGDVQVDFAMTEKTDLQLGYHYYHADNYTPFTGPSTTSSVAVSPAPALAYNSSDEVQGFTATVAYQLRPNMLWKVRYGYFKNVDATSGYNNNYDAHLVYSSFEFQF